MPRAGLSRAVVVTEAARVADEVGLERLTLAAVASRLGVRLPSLYKHIAGLEALQVHLAAAAGRELAAELSAATVGRSKTDALLAMAAATAVLQIVLSVLAGFGLEGEDAIDAVRGLRALLHGFVAIEAAGGFKLPQDLDRSYRRLVQTYADTLSTWGRTASADAR